MASFTDSKAYTADDATLLRAIDFVEGRIPAQVVGRDVDLALQELIINRPQFQIIRDNEHLRTLLRAFLEANLAVERVRDQLTEREAVPRWIGIFKRSSLLSLQTQLAALEAQRDPAYKAYEMLRKLTDNENSLLKRFPA